MITNNNKHTTHTTLAITPSTSTTLGVHLIDFKTYARPYCVKEAVMKFPQGSLERSMVEFICIFGIAEMLLCKGALKHTFLHLKKDTNKKT